jgi:hypothetical protein
MGEKALVMDFSHPQPLPFREGRNKNYAAAAGV